VIITAIIDLLPIAIAELLGGLPTLGEISKALAKGLLKVTQA
jgi:hypothetical protein